jgi:hypothetical protein
VIARWFVCMLRLEKPCCDVGHELSVLDYSWKWNIDPVP